MAVRRRRTARPAKRPEASRVHKVTSQQQWDKLTAKLGDRLLFAHFSGAWAQPSTQLRPFFAAFAKRAAFSHVVFAEVDVDQLRDLAERIGVQACPTIVCWRHNELVEMSARGEGGTPQKVLELLHRHAGEKPEAPRWRQLLLKAVMFGAAAAAVGLGIQHLRTREPPTASSRAAKLEEQIQVVQLSMADAKRRRQSKTVKQLQQQLERLSKEKQEINRLLHEAETLDDVPASFGTADEAQEQPSGYSSEEDVAASFDGSSLMDYSESDDDP